MVVIPDSSSTDDELTAVMANDSVMRFFIPAAPPGSHQHLLHCISCTADNHINYGSVVPAVLRMTVLNMSHTVVSLLTRQTETTATILLVLRWMVNGRQMLQTRYDI